MFRNRKKSSSKRSDDQRDRDNSRVLEGCTDTEPLPSSLPYRRASMPAGNFQYLKLTDGFNIVLSSDTGETKTPAPSSQNWLSPQLNSSSLNRRNAEKKFSDEKRENERKAKPRADTPTDGGTYTQHADPCFQEETEYVNMSGTTSSITTVISHNVQGESPELPVRSETSETTEDLTRAGIHVKPSATLSSEIGPAPRSKKALSAEFDDTVCAHGPPVPGSIPRSKQDDKHIGSIGDSTSKTDRGGGRGELSGTGRWVDNKHRVDSGRGASDKTTNQSPVLSRVEVAAQADFTQSLSCLNDSAAKREGEVDTHDDRELNKAREEHSGFTSTASNSQVSHSADHRVRQKADTAEITISHTQFGQREIQEPSPWHALEEHSGTRSLRGKGVTRTAHVGQSLKTAFVDVGHDSADNSSDGGRSKAAGFTQSLTRVGRKKTSARITGDMSESKKYSFSDMLRSNRHAHNTKHDVGEKPAVYRKLEDTDTDPASVVPHTDRAPGGAEPTSEHPAQQPPPTEHRLPPKPLPTPPRPRPPALLPKLKKKSPDHIYENVSINQAFTRIVNTNLDDEDDEEPEEVDSDSVSTTGSTLDRQSAQGSKDSGLCVDVQSVVMVAAEGGTGSGGDDDGGDGTGGLCVEEEEGRDGGGRIQHGEEEEHFEVNIVEDVVDEESAIYENTAVLPRLPDDGDSSAGTPEMPGSPDSRQLTPSMAAGRRRRHHHDNHSLTSTASEDDNRHDLSTSGDSSFDGDEEENTPLMPSARENMEKMRHLLVKGVQETEKTYLAILELLLHYKRTLEASCRTSQPVISEEDIGCVFSNLQELRDIHKVFVEGLQAKVDSWGPEQTVGDVFMCLVEKFPQFGAYAENYPTAVTTIHKCSQDNHRFQDLATQIVLTSTTREVTSLEDALFKPVQRLQRNTLVLYDLIKHTPKNHPDQETLQNALHLSQRNLENFGTSLVPRYKVEQKGQLVKSSFLVELVGVSRKLRYIFVFSEMLVCTKREQENRGGEVTFDCKWFIPINLLQLDTKFVYQDDNKFSKRDEIEDLKKKLRSIKTEIKKELKKEDKLRPVSSLVPSRTVEKLQRKANELEGQLILASPRLPFKVWHDSGKVHTFLMTTDYEREEWRELLSDLQKNSTAETESVPPSAFGVQEMVNSVRGLPEINEIGSVLVETEEEAIYGTLNVTVHKLTGLSEPCDTYCCLEMDSYGHFFMKARTHISSKTIEPSWNADFELDLEGSQTLRVLCYKQGPSKQGDILLCRGALELTKAWLKGGSFQEKIVTMNEYSLLLSICYTEAETTLRRTPARQSGTAVFGVQICTSATREGKTVPTIVTACVQEVERRGMKETGIYRVSGVTSDVQRLKKQFDKNVKVGVSSLGEVEIHTVTSLLKLYLRELPDPVFTEASYPNFLDALKLNDKEGKEKCMLSLFYNLPDINYYTAVYLLEHLFRISRYEAENKMSIHNLSTIFGPTLLAPAPEKMAGNVSQLMTLGAEHCMKQSEVVNFYLGLLATGVSLRRSSAALTVTV